MLELHDFILLKAVFDEELHNAILDKDDQKIKELIDVKYEFELNNGFVSGGEINTNELSIKHNEQLESDNFKWAF